MTPIIIRGPDAVHRELEADIFLCPAPDFLSLIAAILFRPFPIDRPYITNEHTFPEDRYTQNPVAGFTCGRGTGRKDIYLSG